MLRARRICSTTLPILAALCLPLGCAPTGATGTTEADEFYATSGLLDGEQLFVDGLAPVVFVDQPFLRVGVRWDAPAETEIEVRVADEQGNWSAWLPLQASWTEGILHSGHVDVPGTTAVGVQMRHLSGPEPSWLVAEAIDEVGEPLDTGILFDLVPDEAGADDKGDIGSAAQGLGPASLVRTRADWNAPNPRCSAGAHRPNRATIHHTVTPVPDSISPAARMRQMQGYHMYTHGWCDIGYHFVVDRNGTFWQGRDEATIGAHVSNNNTGNVGVSFMGTYNTLEPTQLQIDNTATLLGWLNQTYGILLTRSNIKGHREYRGNQAGDCPGDKVYARIPNLLSGGGQVHPENGTLQGVVFVDRGNGDMSQRIPGAELFVVGSEQESVLARGGDAFWVFSLPAGQYAITANARGYQANGRNCTVHAGQETWCSIGLAPEPTHNDPPPSEPDPPADPPPPSSPVQRAMIFGKVLIADDALNLAQCSGHAFTGAVVNADSGERRAVDRTGYYELWVGSGVRTVTARVPNGTEVRQHTTVTAGGEAELCFSVNPTNWDDIHSEQPRDPRCSQLGSSPGSGGGLGVLAMLALFGLVLRQRNRC